VRGVVKKPASIISLLSDVKHNSSDNYSSSDSDHGSTSDIGSSPSSIETLENNKILLWQQLSILMTPSIQRVVEFAKRIPGFLDLTQDDQLILIKIGFFEIWLVHISRMINTCDNTLTFSDGSFITRHQLQVMFDYDFINGIFNFMVSFNSFNLNDSEIALFSAAVLLQSGLSLNHLESNLYSSYTLFASKK
jgi:nuclear receptor subfamily 1 group D protein 3